MTLQFTDRDKLQRLHGKDPITENSFGMFSANGNALVKNLFDRIIGMPMSTPKRMVEDEIAKGFGRIESLDNGEVWDTEVKQIFRAELYDATGKYFEIMYRTSDGNSKLKFVGK